MKIRKTITCVCGGVVSEKEITNLAEGILISHSCGERIEVNGDTTDDIDLREYKNEIV